MAVAGGVLYAPAAVAHGGPIELTLNPDGAGGFELFAHYQDDGHVVESILDPVLEAEAVDGRTAGPVTLISSAEGQGRWVTSEPVLAQGEWTVTVSTTTPEEASLTTTVSVVPIEVPEPPEPVAESADLEGPEPDTTAQADVATENAANSADTAAVPVWAIGALAGVAIVAVGVIVWRRRAA